MAALKQTAHTLRKGNYLAQNLRKWGCAFIIDRKDLPINASGQHNESLLDDKFLAQEINLHLQGVGKYVKAMDIVQFLDTPEMKESLNCKTTIHLATAQRWMHKLNYCWSTTPKGQYVDGHEHEDVVAYCQNEFLPALIKIDANLRKWTGDATKDLNAATISNVQHTVVWYHNELVFYANVSAKVPKVGKGLV